MENKNSDICKDVRLTVSMNVVAISRGDGWQGAELGETVD